MVDHVSRRTRDDAFKRIRSSVHERADHRTLDHEPRGARPQGFGEKA
jgi:hypothetical protein